MQRLLKMMNHSKNAQSARALRQVVIRRVLGLTLVIAGISMVLSGIASVFFH
jgi:small neutral amino acid transporter SnatA (MarC family)